MANIKSAKKRILVAETKAARNKAIRSKVKTYEGRCQIAGEVLLPPVVLNAMVGNRESNQQGVYHQNTAQKAFRLLKAVAKRYSNHIKINI